MDNWVLVDTRITQTTIEDFMKIVEDALSHGFEFKVENGNIYFRLE